MVEGFYGLVVVVQQCWGGGFGGNGCWDGILVVKVVAACRRKRENK